MPFPALKDEAKMSVALLGQNACPTFSNGPAHGYGVEIFFETLGLWHAIRYISVVLLLKLLGFALA